MKKTTFTDTMIRKLKPAETKIRISEGNGFTIRVMPTGLKTWLYLYSIEGNPLLIFPVCIASRYGLT